jgi:Cu2+-exporting ATPase
VKGDLQGIVKAKKLSHAVMKISIKTYFAFFNVLGIPIAAGVLYPFSVFTFANDCSTSDEF